jgi:hypothetical protein
VNTLCFHFFDRVASGREGVRHMYIDKDKIENSGSQTSGQGKGDGPWSSQAASPKTAFIKGRRTSRLALITPWVITRLVSL